MPSILLISMMLLSGCTGTHQGWNSKKSSVLVNPDILLEGGEGEAHYRYVKPGFDIKQYSSVVVEPVLIAKEGELDAEERVNYRKLADNAYIYLVREISKEIRVVQEGGESGTLNLQMAILDADSSKPVRMITSSATPIGAGISFARFTTTGKQSGVGEITTEYRLTDYNSGELLMAAVDRQVGEKSLPAVRNGWYHADLALQYWARQIGFLLCTHLKHEGCQKP